MKIGIEVQRLFRRKKHGMEIVALEIIRVLQKTDHTNQYIIFAKDDVDNQCIGESANFSVDKSNNASYPIWEQFQLLKAVNKAKPDILHCTANTAPLFCSVPLIITIHDVIYLESLNFSGSSYQNFGNIYRRYIVPKVAKKASVVLTVSEYEKKVIVDRLKISPEKVSVVYNGVNNQFKPIADKASLEDFRKKYNLPAKFLLHFGNTAPKKNTIGVLEAFKIYRASVVDPLPLVLTDCTSAYVSELLNQVNAPELMNHIQILDYIPFGSIPLLYNLATIFLYPSLRESFGMPLIEAMACGVPVITSNTSALPEIAGGAACLVDPKKPAEIFDQIMLLLSDKKFYNERKEKGYKNATRFSWERAAQQTGAIYNELMTSRKVAAQPATMEKIVSNFKMHFSMFLFGRTNRITNRR